MTHFDKTQTFSTVVFFTTWEKDTKKQDLTGWFFRRKEKLSDILKKIKKRD